MFFPRILQFCLNYAIFDELCEKLRFEVNYAKSQHRRISEALLKQVLKTTVKLYKRIQTERPENCLREWWDRKFVSAPCLQSHLCNLLAYAINCMYTQGVMLLELNLQNLIAI